ncbi:MAG: hypothetical protein H0M93_05260 [Methanophagales archaeon]|nr:hypothetical protein [Methanophagales archaeon]
MQMKTAKMDSGEAGNGNGNDNDNKQEGKMTTVPCSLVASRYSLQIDRSNQNFYLYIPSYLF